MLSIAKIDHLVLTTNKLDEMITFYCQVLGCHIERQVPQIGLTQLRAGEALIDLLETDLLATGQSTEQLITHKQHKNLDHFCLLLNKFNKDELLAHLKQHQIEPGEFVKRYGAQGNGDSLYISDPENNTIELKENIK